MSKTGIRKSLALILALSTCVAVLAGCNRSSANSSDSSSTEGSSAAATDTKAPTNSAGKEVYAWCCQYNSLPLFVNNDYIGLDLISKQLGVQVDKVGPQQIDLPGFIASIEQEIAKKPAGMLVVGWDASEADSINKAIAAGIPVVTDDADVPKSNRLAFVGTDWYELGYTQAEAVAPKLQGKTGKAVVVGLPTGDNNVSALSGYTAALKTLAPNITVVQQIYDSQSNAQKVAETVSNLLQSDQSIVAVAGFDSSSGPGISQAIKETNAQGRVYGTCVDAEAEQLQGVKEGTLLAAVGQKRVFFTYYGIRLLYDYYHNGIQYTKNDREIGITPIPSNITTGFIVATSKNVDALMDAAKSKSK